MNAKFNKKISEFKVLRYPNLTDNQRAGINTFLSEKMGLIKYDKTFFRSLVMNGILRMSLFKTNDPEKWICTEVVTESYKAVDVDLLKNELPSPLAIEKMAADGTLIVVANFY